MLQTGSCFDQFVGFWWCAACSSGTPTWPGRLRPTCTEWFPVCLTHFFFFFKLPPLQPKQHSTALKSWQWIWKKKKMTKKEEEGGWTGRVEIRTRKKFPMGEAYTAVFWPTPGFEGRTSVNSGFSTEGTLLSASAVPHCWLRIWYDTTLFNVISMHNA